MPNYDRSVMLSNISLLAKRQHKRIGDIETKSGVSTGYFSRLNREDNQASPSIETVCAIANALDVTVDDLVSIDFSKLNPTQEYLISFINKMIKDTQEDRIFWKREEAYDLNRLEPDYDGDVSHPLFFYETYKELNEDGEDEEETSRVCFKSAAYGYRTEVWGNCFNVRLKNDVYIYVMFVGPMGCDDSERKYNEDVELWTYNGNNREQQCICNSMGQTLYTKKLEKLYREIQASDSRPKIPKSLQYVIDAYMNDDLDDDPPLSFEEMNTPF